MAASNALQDKPLFVAVSSKRWRRMALASCTCLANFSSRANLATVSQKKLESFLFCKGFLQFGVYLFLLLFFPSCFNFLRLLDAARSPSSSSSLSLSSKSLSSSGIKSVSFRTTSST
eukprot:g3884.t1